MEYKDNSVLETSLKSRYQIQKLFDLKYINQLFIGIDNEVNIMQIIKQNYILTKYLCI